MALSVRLKMDFSFNREVLQTAEELRIRRFKERSVLLNRAVGKRNVWPG